MMKNRFYQKTVPVLVCILLASFYSTPIPAKTTKKTVRRVSYVSSKISDVKYWTGAESSQIAFYLQGSVNYDVSDLPGNKGFVFYSTNASCSNGDGIINVNDGVIDKISIDNSSRSCRITVTFQVPTEYKVSRGHVDRNYPVIEIDRPANLRPARLTPQQIAELKKDHKIILIDPGHGGWHYGAGGNGLSEKYITMELALELKKKIDAMPGMISFLTRDPNFNNGDYYVSLTRRREMAAEYGADLFVSLHLNSPGRLSRRDVHGTEVYFMAYGDASDKEAQELADLENAADLEPGEATKPGDVISELLLDERMIALNNQSSLLAGLVINSMMQAEGLTSRGVKHARFAVLKNTVPAVLVEVAFVTNPREAKLLKDTSFKIDLANKISDAINQYLAINKGRPTETQSTANSSPAPTAQ